jgi:hypothetical protein
MAAGQRPGGLTALAVLNFVFGGIKAILVLLAIAAIGVVAHEKPDELREAFAQQPNQGLMWASIALGLVTTILLIVSGVGYIKQKRVMGRTLGNLYAVCSLADSGIALAVGSNMLGVLIFAVYPLLTLLLLNTTFKEDLVN